MRMEREDIPQKRWAFKSPEKRPDFSSSALRNGGAFRRSDDICTGVNQSEHSQMALIGQS